MDPIISTMFYGVDGEKRLSIDQAIVNAANARSCIAPLTLGLGIEVDKVFGSKWVLTELNHFEFSISHDVTKNLLSVMRTLVVLLNVNLSGSFSQWFADNVDHNVCMLDGKGTLHGMDLIVSTTPGSSLPSLTHIPRQKMRYVDQILQDEEFLPHQNCHQ